MIPSAFRGHMGLVSLSGGSGPGVPSIGAVIFGLGSAVLLSIGVGISVIFIGVGVGIVSLS